jgi:hypothetical protein
MLDLGGDTWRSVTSRELSGDSYRGRSSCARAGESGPGAGALSALSCPGDREDRVESHTGDCTGERIRDHLVGDRIEEHVWQGVKGDRVGARAGTTSPGGVCGHHATAGQETTTGRAWQR